MPGAAFFDLDRTLLQGGTGPHLTPGDGRPRRRAALAARAGAAVQGVRPRSARTSRRSSSPVRRPSSRAARTRRASTPPPRNAAEVIAELVHPFALALIEQHKAEGRPVVMATTTPEHLIKPLADLLGFDHVLATRYGTQRGRPLRRLDPRPVRLVDGQAHRRPALRGRSTTSTCARASPTRTRSSTCRSSRRSGQPAAVNPDPRLAVYAVARRWPIVHFDVSPGVFKIPVVGIELQRFVLEGAAFDVLPVRPLRHRGHREHPAPRPGHPRRQPPQLLRRRRHGQRRAPVGSHGPGARQEGALRGAGARVVHLGAAAASGSTAPRAARVLRHGGARARGWRDGGPAARGDDPARRGVLRPGAQGQDRRRPARRREPRAPVVPVGHVGHREGVAALVEAAQPAQPVEPADRADPGRPAGRAATTARRPRTRSGSWPRSATSCRPRPASRACRPRTSCARPTPAGASRSDRSPWCCG